MSLPNVKISFGNGAIGANAAMEDGVVGLMATAVSVSGKLELGKAYLLTRLADLEALGATAGSTGANGNLYKCVKDFYSEAPAGSKLWMMGVAASVGMDDMVDPDEAYGKALLTAASGAINVLMVKVTDGTAYSPTVSGGLDSAVLSAANKAQALANWATDNLYAPCMVLLEGRHYSGTASELTSLATYQYNRVAIVIGDNKASSDGAAVGLVAGRLASIPVQRSLARVRNGAIASADMYIGSQRAENGSPAVVHDAGYICPRTFVGKGGYYWCDDLMATAQTDDYGTMPRRRVADKAYRIAYQTLVNELGEEVAVTSEGKIASPVLKGIEASVVGAIVNGMTGEGNLGTDPSDPNDLGVECVIADNQNIVATSKLNVGIRIRPYGCSKYIDVELGFLALV